MDNFVQDYRKSGKNTAAFTVNQRRETLAIQAKIERWFSDDKLNRTIVLLNSFMNIAPLFISIFLDSQDTLRWKKEPLSQNMLMQIYHNEIETNIRQLYNEVKELYE
jgi:hypothetical protein